MQYCNRNLSVTIRQLQLVGNSRKLSRCGKEKGCRSEVFYNKGVLRNFTKFAGKHLCQSFFFNKIAGQHLFL